MKEFDYDMINRYLGGELKGDELNAFREQLLQDAELQNEIELVKEVNDTLKMKFYPDDNEQALTESLNKIRGSYFSNENDSKQLPTKIISIKRMRWVVAAAAVFTGLIILTIWSPWKNEDLFTTYASLDMPGVAERGTPADSLLKQAIANFNEKKFAEAIHEFEKLLKGDQQNSYLHYYYSIALLKNGQMEGSRNELSQLYNGNSLFRYDAAFFIALSYLKEKDKAKCREWLNKIPADAAIHVKARELLEKL